MLIQSLFDQLLKHSQHQGFLPVERNDIHCINQMIYKLDSKTITTDDQLHFKDNHQSQISPVMQICLIYPILSKHVAQVFAQDLVTTAMLFLRHPSACANKHL